MTRPGFFKTLNLYNSSSHKEQRAKNGRLSKGWPNIEKSLNGLRLKGLTVGVNNFAYKRGVVMHEAWYNQGSLMGRSYGCPAFAPDEAKEILSLIKNGTLFFAYVPQCEEDTKIVGASIKGWQDFCKDKR